jgi:hypothetical protein
MTTAQKNAVARHFAKEYFVALAKAANFNHDELVAAADATADYIDTIKTSYNNALPLPFRSNATTAEKTLLFCYVAMKDAGII